MSLTYRFRLSDEEHARAWLREYYRRPGWRMLRIVGGPVIVFVGIAMLRSEDLFTVLMGICAILLGLWYGLKPLLAAHLIRRERRRSGRSQAEITLTLGRAGIRIDDGRVRTELDWSDVTAAGRGPDYIWYEIGRGARATIPLRVVDDRDALERLLREKTRWTG